MKAATIILLATFLLLTGCEGVYFTQAQADRAQAKRQAQYDANQYQIRENFLDSHPEIVGEDRLKILKGEEFLGMTEEEFAAANCTPLNELTINQYASANGSMDQVQYGGSFYYFENNKLVSWQINNSWP